MCYHRRVGSGLTVLAVWMVLSAGSAQGPVDTWLAEPIESVYVRVCIAGEGDLNLDGLGLDLGLGFSFSLSSNRSAADQALAFHAWPTGIEQSTVEGDRVITATFESQTQPAGDLLDATRSLLAGLNVSDIARAGIIVSPNANVTLRSLQITVNGNELYARDEIDQASQTAVELAKKQQDESVAALTQMMSTIRDIEAFAEVDLASADDLAELQRLRESRQQIEQTLVRVDGVLSGHYPFFVDDAFAAGYRSEGLIGSGAVTLVTADHGAAGTDDFVFLQLGGKKFLLDQPSERNSFGDRPLDPLGVVQAISATQRFDLDLLAAPLTASDVRGLAIGQIASGQPGSTAPDRWHPLRVLVELDGRVVFDSDESDVNRKSLEVIRMIPPVHFDEQGKPVRTLPASRECSLWKAGHGQGLDLVGGGVKPLPPPGDPNAPLPEPTPGGFGDDPWGAIPDVGSGNNPPGNPGDIPLFPGEPPPPGADAWGDGGGGGFDSPGDPPWQPWPNGPGDPGGSAGGWGGPGLWNLLDHIVIWLLGKLPPPPPGTDAPPFGDKFALEQVQITKGWKQGDTFQVAWDTSGDIQAIDHYDVRMTVVHPYQSQNVFGPEVFASAKVPANQNQIDFLLLDDALYFLPKDAFYIAPIVTAVPKDSKESPHERSGPAHLVFPPNSLPLAQAKLKSEYAVLEGPPSGPLTANVQQIQFQEPADPNQNAVWIVGEVDSQNALLFADARPGINCVLRPSPTKSTQRFILTLTREEVLKRNKFEAQLAFLGRSPGGNKVSVNVLCTLESMISNKKFPYLPDTFLLSDSAGGDPAPTVEISKIIDEADANFGEPTKLVIHIYVNVGDVDTANPPVLLGMSVNPIP